MAVVMAHIGVGTAVRVQMPVNSIDVGKVISRNGELVSV